MRSAIRWPIRSACAGRSSDDRATRTRVVSGHPHGRGRAGRTWRDDRTRHRTAITGAARSRQRGAARGVDRIVGCDSRIDGSTFGRDVQCVVARTAARDGGIDVSARRHAGRLDLHWATWLLRRQRLLRIAAAAGRRSRAGHRTASDQSQHHLRRYLRRWRLAEHERRGVVGPAHRFAMFAGDRRHRHRSGESEYRLCGHR